MLLPQKRASWSVIIKVILLLLCLIILKNARLAHGDHAFVWDNGTWIDLGPFAVSESSRAWGINDNGQIVGEGVHILLSENGEITDLGTSEPCGRSANDINNQDQIVGLSGHAFLCENGEITDLGGNWLPFAINNYGQIVGPGSSHTILWENGEITDLGSFKGEGAFPYDINDLGQIVGRVDGAASEYGRNWAGFLWEDGEITDLGGLTSEPTEAHSINNFGQVVGESYKEGQPHAFLWENGVMTELHSDGWKASSAWGINDLGQVVIQGYFTELAKRGGAYWSKVFLWDNGTMIDLGTLGGRHARPMAINNKGQIVGFSDRRWYVDVNNPAPGNGKSWSEAFNTIQEAVDIAHYHDEIWVMKGTYLLSSTINVTKRLFIYGGFGGWENNVEERDLANNVTIVDGQDQVRCLNIAASNAWIDGFVFTRGHADLGGAIYNDNSHNLYIVNCIFSENTAESGGAIYNAGQLVIDDDWCDPCPGDSSIENSVFFGNTAQYGGAVYSDTYYPAFETCTFFRNSAEYGGGIYSKDSGTVLFSSILWADTATVSQEIFENDSSYTVVEYSDIQGGYPGEGNIDADPLFIDEENGDYHLTARSPCVDAGSHSQYCDLEGDRRTIGSAPDIGADEFPCAVNTYYKDSDGDGYGDPNDSVRDCSQPSGYVADNTDCDDQDAKEHPNQTWYKDKDNDGYSDGTTNTTSCTRPTGYKVASELTATSGDCDDTDPSIHPGATEVCNGKDDDCDGSVDEGVQATYFRDADRDGYGDPNNWTQACSQPSGYILDNTDCDDSDPIEHPDQTWYKDFDNDGYSEGTVDTTSCTRPAGYKVISEVTAIWGDCDDTDSSIHPGATESCNGKDDDCNGVVDDGLPKTTYYQDDDGDGYGDASGPLEACAQPPGYVTNTSDCDGKDPDQHPGAQEICNGEDDDCDGQIDESCIYSFDTYPVQGTIGTQLTINGWGCGDKKGKVTVGTSKCKVLEWTNTSISCLIKKVPRTMGPGTYGMTIKTKGKGTEPIVIEDAFSILAPRIQNISPDRGEAKDEIIITGSFFGTKKVKVYMDDGIGKKPKKCKVTSLTMDSETGESVLQVLVPKGLNRGVCDVTVLNKVGSHTFIDGFTVD